MCTAGSAICLRLARLEGSVEALSRESLQADIVMGQDGRSKGWGTLNCETEADAERAFQVHSFYSLQTLSDCCATVGTYLHPK